MNNRWRQPRNDGWTNVDYDFGLASPSKEALAADLNELCHVFRHHADGHWASVYKQRYVDRIADHIRTHPKLSYRLFSSGERVIQSVTHQAIDLLKRREHGPDDTSP